EVSGRKAVAALDPPEHFEAVGAARHAPSFDPAQQCVFVHSLIGADDGTMEDPIGFAMPPHMKLERLSETGGIGPLLEQGFRKLDNVRGLSFRENVPRPRVVCCNSSRTRLRLFGQQSLLLVRGRFPWTGCSTSPGVAIPAPSNDGIKGRI